jgi:hypothetical protein
VRGSTDVALRTDATRIGLGIASEKLS